MRRAATHVSHVLFDASREGRSAEIVGWSHALVSLELAAGVFVLTRSLPYGWGIALAAGVVGFIVLRAAMTNALTLWFAAFFGTTAVAALAGGLGWLFGHLVDLPSVPPITGALSAVIAGLVPAFAYRRIGKRRSDGVVDSLLAPRVPPPPPSRPSFA